MNSKYNSKIRQATTFSRNIEKKIQQKFQDLLKG